MAYDFRANQVRLNRIISSGSAIYVYASSSATNYQGVPTFPTTNIGTDVFLFVSGSSHAKTLFGGDVTVSGALGVIGAISGSISGTMDGNPYIIGSGITVNYNSLGQYELTSSAGIPSTLITYGDSINRGSGSISGLFGLSAGQIGKYEVQIIAKDSSGTDGATWKYSVSCFYPMLGSFSFIGVNELTFDHTPSANVWDVNFNNSGEIELTGSTSTLGTLFYTQISNEIIL